MPSQLTGVLQPGAPCATGRRYSPIVPASSHCVETCASRRPISYHPTSTPPSNGLSPGAPRLAGVLRVLLVDDEPDIRFVVRHLLSRISGVEVVGEAVDGVDAYGKWQQLGPDVIITDHSMPRRSGLELLGLVLEQQPEQKAVMFSAHASLVAAEARALGVCALIDKSDVGALADVVSRLVEQAT